MKCYLCKSPMRFFLRKNGYDIFRCATCGLGQTDLKQKYSAFVRDHYSEGYFTGEKHHGAYSGYKADKAYIQRNHKKFLAQVAKFKPSGKLLDVGCALGFTVELALSRGYDAYGFDPSAYAVKEARSLVGTRRIKQGTIDSVTYPKASFDVITLFDVFEHLQDPQKDIRKLVTYLKKDGVMIIATGNTGSFMARALQRRWTFYIPPQHLFFFSKDTMGRLLTNVGLSPTKWFTIGKWLSLQYVLHLARTTGESKLAEKMYPHIVKLGAASLPVYIPAHDNMVVIARKIHE